MKKSLVLVMALVLVVAFAFADEVGRAQLSTDKGVITAGDPLNVSFTLSVEDVAEDVTTIEVMGDEVADNVFVMLIKDLPNEDATYEAQKVVDQDAQKTTYYIKAKELVGTLGKVYAELRDWNGDKVAEAEKEFAWKGTTWTDTLQLVPEKEGLYTVIAYIEFADGTRMELKGWEGYAQLVALDDYVKAAGIDGLTPVLDPAANSLTVRAGVEFMYAKAAEELGSQGEDYTYLGVYGEGSQSSAPSVVWTYNASGMPGFEDVELVYAVNGSGVDQDQSGVQQCTETDTAYIKFKVMQESFEEGDCCATAGTPKWALWFAIGTGEYHSGGSAFYQALDFHVLGTYIYPSYSWSIVKGAECRGWIKAIFYLDPSDVHIWLYAILGTDYCYSVAGQSDTVEGDEDSMGYHQNFLETAELNLIADITIKDVINVSIGALDIPITKDSETPVKVFAAGNVKLVGDAMTIDLGGEYFAENAASMTELYDYRAHVMVSGLTVNLPGFIMESLNNIRLGMILAGDEEGMNDINIYSCFESGMICCLPSFKIGVKMSFSSEEREFSFDQVYGSYSHTIGTYGPVDLSGTLGVIYSMGSTPVDGGDYGLGLVAGSSDYYDWALGVGYEVTGTMTW